MTPDRPCPDAPVTIAIGDLQGCDQPLGALLARIGPEPGEPLWFCGDLVNRGPDSLAALRRVAALGERATVVLGNHDLHLLAAIAGVRPPRRQDTLTQVLEASDAPALTAWLRRRPLAVLSGDFLLVHAGVVADWDAATTVACAREVQQVLSGPHWGDFLGVMYGNQPDRWDDALSGDDRLRAIVNILTRIRYVDAAGRLDLGETRAPPDVPRNLHPWFDAPGRRTANRTVVFGHWSTLGHLDRPNLVALDTGCVWGGCLSGMRLESRALFQVRCPQAARAGD